MLALACSPELYPPFDPTAPGYEFTQTFGQLVDRGGWRPAEFAILKVPAGATIRAVATGTVAYEPDFRGLGPSLVLTPKSYLVSNTDFGALEALPRPAAIRLVFANLIPGEVEIAIKDRYTALNNSNPTLAAQRFMARAETNRRVDVSASATLATNTALGKAKNDSVFIMAVVGEPDAPEETVNPLPYLMAAFPSAQAAIIDATPPTIGNMALLADDNVAMSDPMVYELPTGTSQLTPPNVLFGHIAMEVAVSDQTGSGPGVGVYELGYEISRVTRDGLGAIVSRVPLSAARYLANSMNATSPSSYSAFYRKERSDPATRTFGYRVHFDPTTPPSSPIEARNYLASGNATSLDVSAWAAGEYEFQIRVRDLNTPLATPVTRTVYARVDNSPAAITAAQWKLQASVGGSPAAESDRNGQLAELKIPGTGAPFVVQASLVNAPVVTAPARYQVTVASNSATAGPANPFVSPASLTITTAGIHHVVVWLDQDGDGVRQPTESWRRVAVITYDLQVAILGSRKHLGGPYTAITTADVIPKGDALKLEVSATFELGHEAFATYRWEVLNKGVTETPAGKIWEKNPLVSGGTYAAKAFVEVFGLTFETSWTQTVVDAAIPAIASICAPHTSDVTVTIDPPALAAGSTVEFTIERPGPASDGDAVFFPGGGTLQPMVGSGTLTIEGRTASVTRDNVDLVAKFDGQELAREKFAVCDMVFLDHGKMATDSLRIARWDNAYGPAPGFAPQNAAAPASNLVDLDPRRFFIRVMDANRNVTPGVADTVEAEFGTTGVITDDFTTIQLIETGISTGIFDSPSMILTSPDLPIADLPDDNFRLHDGRATLVRDDSANDRSHRVWTTGEAHIRYRPQPALAHEDSLDVCGGVPIRRRRLHLRVEVFNEPFSDVGFDHDGSALTPPMGAGDGVFSWGDDGDGIHEPGELSEPFIDLSAGAVAMGVAGARGGMVTAAHVQDQVSRANIAWAQACVRTSYAGAPRFNEAPTRVIGGVVTPIFLDGDTDLPGLDEPAIVGVFAPGAAIDTLVVFFTAPLSGGGANAVARGPFDGVAGMGELTFAYIIPTRDIRFRTLGHEIGHALDNGPDAANPQPQFYPAAATFLDNAVNSYRRITRATEDSARKTRAAGAMVAQGNRMLKSP